MDIKKKAYVFLVIALISGAIIPILLTVPKSANIYEFFFGVYALSVVTSVAFLAYRGRLGELSRTLKDPRKTGMMCLIGIVTYLPVGFGMAYAEKFVTASLAAVIFRTSPLLMLLLLPTLLREKLSKYQIAALCLAFIGLYVGISGGNLTGVFQNSNVGIVLFLILMAFGYALSVVLIKKYVFDLGIVIAVSSITMFALFALLMAVNGFPLYAMSAPQLAVLAYIGVFFNVFSFYIYFTSLRPIKATIVANVYFLSPFITFLFAALFLGEAIQPYYIAIALLAGAGIFIQRFDKVGGRYLASNREGNMRHMAVFDVTGVFANTGETGINAAIQGGGRVLAVKLGDEHAGHVRSMAGAEDSYGIYTDSHEAISAESKYVKDILGVQGGEFVVMKAGRLEECERFFEDLYGRIKAD